jgi:hypothetical protein
MSSIADRNRELLIQRVEHDPRLDGEEVIAVAAVMRISILVTVAAGIIGALVMQVVFGEGVLQFGLGLALGYLAYFGYLAATMDEPRIIGAMAVLTKTRFVLLGSRKRGLVAEYPVRQIESIDMLRKGNIFIMGKMAIKPQGEAPLTFMTTNRRMALDLVTKFEEMRPPGSS